jgi:hypothetical protein
MTKSILDLYAYSKLSLSPEAVEWLDKFGAGRDTEVYRCGVYNESNGES